MFHKILVPLDGSATAEAALKPASFLARAFNAELRLASVEEMPAQILDWDVTQQTLLDKAKTERLDYLNARAHELRQEGCLVDFTYLPLGSPALRLEHEAAEQQADLIVMTSHGRTGLPRLVLGSVAEQLARTAPCPVMIIRQAPVESHQPSKGEAAAAHG